MIGMLVQFDVRQNPESMGAVDLATVIPRYEQIPGLIFKAFIHDHERLLTGGFYVWESQEAMDRFLSGGGLSIAERRFGVKPTIESFAVSTVMNGAAAGAARVGS